MSPLDDASARSVSKKSDEAPPRVLVVEDDDLVRGAYARCLGRAGYELVEASTLSTAWSVVRSGDPLDAAILDVGLTDGRATALVQPLLDRRPLCKSVIITGRDVSGGALMRAGVHEYLQKPVTSSELVRAVHGALMATHSWRRALGQAHGPVPAQERVPSPVPFDLNHAARRLRFLGELTPTQTLVAWRLLWGDRQQRIADMIGCSNRTVKYHVSRVLERVGARSRAELLRVLVEDAGAQDPFKPDISDD